MTEESLNLCLRNHNYSEALIHCQNLMQAGNQSPTIQSIKAWCLFKTGDIASAESLMLQSFFADPKAETVKTIVIPFFMERAEHKKVVELCQQCIAYHDNNRYIWHALGTSHHLLGEYESAVLAFRKSLSIEISTLSVFGLGLALLSLGQYEEGFNLYEARFDYLSLDWIEQKRFPMPKWLGEPLANKSILVWSEQGLGDTIQFSRYITTLSEQGATVDVLLYPAHSGLKDIIENIEGVSCVMIANINNFSLQKMYDFHSPLLSLLVYLGVTPKNVLRNTPYIKSTDNHFSDNVLQHLPNNRLRVGIVWETVLSESLKNDYHMEYVAKKKKSLSLSELSPVFLVEDVDFFIIQTAVSEKDHAALKNKAVFDMSSSIKNFNDTAAIVNDMDLVISIDTAVVHLAGAMGIPTLLLLPQLTDWRWLSNREDTDWYNKTRILRQSQNGNWSEVVDRLIPLLETVKKQYKNNIPIDVTPNI